MKLTRRVLKVLSAVHAECRPKKCPTCRFFTGNVCTVTGSPDIWELDVLETEVEDNAEEARQSK